jgi:hypothetical protein
MDETSTLLGIMTRPELIALATLVAGIIIARLLSTAIGALLEAMDRRAARLTTTDEALVPPALIRLSKVFVFWLVVAGAALIALPVLGVGGIPALLNSALGFMPRLFVAFSVIVAGHLLGLLAAHVLSRANEDWSVDSAAPRLLHFAILAVAIVMGLQHVSIDISFVTRLILILVGTASAGVMLAFSLGARQHVANLLAGRELSRLSIGDRVRIDDVEGVVVEVHGTSVDIATEEGIASVPAARIAESGMLKLSRTASD